MTSEDSAVCSPSAEPSTHEHPDAGGKAVVRTRKPTRTPVAEIAPVIAQARSAKKFNLPRPPVTLLGGLMLVGALLLAIGVPERGYTNTGSIPLRKKLPAKISIAAEPVSPQRETPPLRPATAEATVTGSFAKLAAPELSELIQSARACDPARAERLLKAGADANEVDIRGDSALFWTIKVNCLSVAKLLLGAGADVQAVSASGLSAETWARNYGNRRFIELFAAPKRQLPKLKFMG